jgi:hypothetical protein
MPVYRQGHIQHYAENLLVTYGVTYCTVIRLGNLLRHLLPRDYGPGQKKRKDFRKMSNETLRLFTQTGKGGPLPGFLFLIICTRERERVAAAHL